MIWLSPVYSVHCAFRVALSFVFVSQSGSGAYWPVSGYRLTFVFHWPKQLPVGWSFSVAMITASWGWHSRALIFNSHGYTYKIHSPSEQALCRLALSLVSSASSSCVFSILLWSSCSSSKSIFRKLACFDSSSALAILYYIANIRISRRKKSVFTLSRELSSLSLASSSWHFRRSARSLVNWAAVSTISTT